MADITAIFGILLFMGIAYPGMLNAWELLFPAAVERAYLRVEKTPWQSFWLGAILTLMAGIPIMILLSLPSGPAKFIGAGFALLILSVSSLGSAGLAQKLAARIKKNNNFNQQTAFILGAVIIELAVVFPIAGWFLVLPFILFSSIGATAFALLNWQPKMSKVQTVDSTLAQV